MIIYIGADHRGFNLKEKLKAILLNEAYTVVDVGAEAVLPEDDYPDYAVKVAEGVRKNPSNDRGILICGSGFGMDMSANKIKEIRAALPMSSDHAFQARHDDDANVLALAADFIDDATAIVIVKTFLLTPFAKEERYQRRIEKIDKL